MYNYQEGQILLIVVLVMVTALTVGLSVAARSITDTRTSQDSASSEKAFSAAQAGIEKSLQSANGSVITNTLSNNTSYKATVTTVDGISFALNNGTPILKDSSTYLWLSTYPTYANPYTGFLTVYWGQASNVCSASQTTNTMAALELIVISGTKAAPQMAEYAFDPCSARSLSNKLTYTAPGGGTVNGVTYSYKATINVTNGLFMNIIPLYAPAYVAVSGCNNVNADCLDLPGQGNVIQSTGTAGDTQRELVTDSYYPQLPPEIFQYSLFSP